MSRLKEYCVGDLVELKTYERQPRLRGIILERLGYDKSLDDFVYLIFCFSRRKINKKVKSTHRTIEKI